jgi:hypothetical protein
MKILKYIILTILFISCSNKEKDTIFDKVIKLPKSLKEISGIGYWNNELYCIQDNGNKNEVIVLDTLGKIKRTIIIKNTINIDWEDVTFDTKGNLYIGDFGNNENKRKDLIIYKINNSELSKTEANIEYKISFNYPEQKDFPPKQNELLFDCEAFFEFENHFYLFTKNRSKDFDGSSFIYRIPNTKGNVKAQSIDTIITCSNKHNCLITSAAISKNHKSFVQLSGSKIWQYKINLTIENATCKEIRLNHNSQKEAICFKNDSTVVIADERIKKSGGYLYFLKVSNAKN